MSRPERGTGRLAAEVGSAKPSAAPVEDATALDVLLLDGTGSDPVQPGRAVRSIAGALTAAGARVLVATAAEAARAWPEVEAESGAGAARVLLAVAGRSPASLLKCPLAMVDAPGVLFLLDVPESVDDAAAGRFFDELWVPSRAIAEAVAHRADRPVRVVGLPGHVRLEYFVGRRHFKIPESAFVFLALVDADQKDAEEAALVTVRAFRRVLGSHPAHDVALVLRLKGPWAGSSLETIRGEALRCQHQVIVLARSLADTEETNLLRCADAVVSLHEWLPFGQDLAQAMFLGKPVIATARAGNLEFMNAKNSLLVNGGCDTDAPVGEGTTAGLAGRTADLMAKLMTDRGLRQSLAAAARRDLLVGWSELAIGLGYVRELRATRRAARECLSGTQAATPAVHRRRSVVRPPAAGPVYYAEADPPSILFVSHDAHRYGAQMVLLDMLRWTKGSKGVTSKVLFLDGGPLVEEFGAVAEIVVLDGAGEDLDPRDVLNGARRLFPRPPDLVYGNTGVTGRYYAALSELGAPIITHVHELQKSIERFVGPEVMGEVVARSRHFIAVSPPVAENLRARWGVPDSKISLVYPHIRPRFDSEVFRRRAEVRRSLGLPLDTAIVWGTGSTDWRKGPDLFVDVAASLVKGGRRDVRFIWLGGDFGAQRALIEHLGVAGYVSFRGPTDDPRAYFAAGDIFCLPSREDPFPLVCLEAAEAGLPVVCFDGAGGMPALVREGAGCVVPFGDVDEMAVQTARLIADSTLRDTLGRNGRSLVLERHTTETQVPQLLASCRAVVRGRPRVSIIIPNYNYARYLEGRMRSVYEQTATDFEVIILDDGSTDGSLELLREYEARPNTRILATTTNSGSVFRQWLRGLSMANGDLVWIAEADDRCESSFLDRLVPHFDDPDVVLAYCHSRVIDGNGALVEDLDYRDGYLGDLSATKWLVPYHCPGTREVEEGLGVRNTIPNVSAVVFRKSAVTGLVASLTKYRFSGDWLLYLHLASRGAFCYDPEGLNFHRRHDRSVVAQTLRAVPAVLAEFRGIHEFVLANFTVSDELVRKMFHFVYETLPTWIPGLRTEDVDRYYLSERLRAAKQSSAHSREGTCPGVPA